MNHTLDIQFGVSLLLTSGLLISCALYYALTKYIHQWQRVASIAALVTIVVSVIAGGYDFSIYTAYEIIRGEGLFYADMFIDGVDATQGRSISDVVSHQPMVIFYALVAYLFFSIFGGLVACFLISFFITLLMRLIRVDLSMDKAFFVLAPVVVMSVGASILYWRADFSEGAVSKKLHYFNLDVAMTNDELQALDAVCPSDSAIFMRYGISCSGEFVAEVGDSFSFTPYRVVAVWSDDLQEHIVFIEVSSNELSAIDSKAKVTADAQQSIRRLTASLLDSPKHQQTNSLNKKEWGDSEIILNH